MNKKLKALYMKLYPIICKPFVFKCPNHFAIEYLALEISSLVNEGLHYSKDEFFELINDWLPLIKYNHFLKQCMPYSKYLYYMKCNHATMVVALNVLKLTNKQVCKSTDLFIEIVCTLASDVSSFLYFDHVSFSLIAMNSNNRITCYERIKQEMNMSKLCMRESEMTKESIIKWHEYLCN